LRPMRVTGCSMISASSDSVKFLVSFLLFIPAYDLASMASVPPCGLFRSGVKRLVLWVRANNLSEAKTALINYRAFTFDALARFFGPGPRM
jgi:hypothetical protein